MIRLSVQAVIAVWLILGLAFQLSGRRLDWFKRNHSYDNPLLV